MKLIARRNGFPFFRPVSPGRRLLVRMDTTNHCNLRCSMCPMSLSEGNTDRNWHHMSREVFSSIVDEVFPRALTVGISCGAEPLTNPRFADHLEELYRSGVPYRQMVTNGTLLNREWIRLIMAFPPTTLFVSIDGACDETHGRIRDGANLSDTIAILRELIAYRGKKRFPMVAFSTTLQRNNLREMSDIVTLASETGAVSAGFVPLVPYEGLGTLQQVVDLNSDEAKKCISQAEKTAEAAGIQFFLSQEGMRRTAPHPCPYLIDTVYIDPDGSIFPCPYWNTGNPLGNVLNGFDNVWKGDEYHRLRTGQFSEADNCLRCPEITGCSKTVIKGNQ